MAAYLQNPVLVVDRVQSAGEELEHQVLPRLLPPLLFMAMAVEIGNHLGDHFVPELLTRE